MEEEFDFEAYVEQRMREISAFSDKVLFKEVVGKVMVDLFRHTQKEYQSLEQRVLQEVQPERKDTTIFLGLTTLEAYDNTDSFCFPMREEDLLLRDPFASFEEEYQEGVPYFLHTIYLEADAISAMAFAKAGTFPGVLFSGEKEYAAVFLVQRSQRYLDQIKTLYAVFETNSLPFSMVCAVHLYKLFDVAVVSVTGLKQEDKASIQGARVSFGEFEAAIRYQRIPIWNLVVCAEKTSTYPEPCLDKINYEHRIFAQRFQLGCTYLVANTEKEITNIRRREGDLLFTCPKKEAGLWCLYRVNPKTEPEHYPYPLFSNEEKESFSGNLWARAGARNQTKGEVARRIHAFSLEAYLEFQSLTFSEERPKEVETYSMDPYAAEEKSVFGRRPSMLLWFLPKQDVYFLQDLMSFLVSQIQRGFPEYACFGKLRKKEKPEKKKEEE